MVTPTLDLPAGIVTFVFTDIEGSTRLVHRLGDGYVEVLERHRQILREAWSAHHGREVSVEGDAFFVAFERADDAVRACIAAQRGLLAEPWPVDGGVMVRMGIHTGLATPYAGDYVALAVHQAARIVAAGHGGQILVSEQTAERIQLNDELDLRPLGRYRLRDFDQPEEVFGVFGEGLPTDLPAIRAVPADGHNLVRQPNPTIGRDEIVARVADEIRPLRLTTLVGPGGVGKSRVAGDIGVRIAPAWADGVWRVDLAAVTESDLAAAAIAEEVGAPARPGSDRWTDLVEHLATRQAVILLDNCEHLVTVCQHLIGSLFDSCEGVSVLATSREPIRVSGELLFPVPPLPLPDPGTTTPEEALSSPAIRLFVERGSAVRPGFALDDRNTATVVSICQHLDGLPLSLELAAANLAVQSAAEILAGLKDRFRLLRSRDRELTDRHHTMEGVLEWSYRLLTDVEQVAFRRVSIFGTTFSLRTASAAVAPDGIAGADVPDLIWSLVDRSLVAAELAADDTRYRLLETIQTYGRDRLAEAGETEAVAVSLADYLLDHTGPWHPADRRWLGEVGVELDNLRALVPLLAGDRQELAQQIASTIGRYHDATHSFRAGIEELTRYADSLIGPSSVRVSMLATLADLHLRTDDTETATRLVEEAEALQRIHGLPEWDDVAVDRTRGEVARRSGDLPGAVAIARRALERDLSDRGRSRMYNLWGTSAAALGDLTTAQQALSQELDLNRRVGYEPYVASALGNLAEVALRLGDIPAAARHQRACLELATAQGSLPMVAYSLIVAARVAGSRQDWTPAVRLHGKGEALLSKIGLVLYDDDRKESNRLLGEAGEALGQSSFDQAHEEGNVLDMPEAIRLADSVLAGAEHPQVARE
ncbi:MAG: tetratricopeptide repeat protein [Acidimicrobiia bacterium]|nr:tetratricopeptide repeat protein [Acidimicrobiia bacterium]